MELITAIQILTIALFHQNLSDILYIICGNAALCSCKTDVVLGNLYKNTFSEIWNSEGTRKLHNEFVKCNACWSSCNRAFDLHFFKGKKAGRKEKPDKVTV